MRVLIIDDEAMVRDLLGSVVEELGCTVLKAAQGLEAVQILQQQPVDLVLTDVHMPMLGGWETVRRIREHGFNVPIIVMDSYPELFTESPERTQVQAVLAKPFDLEVLRSCIRQYLDGRWEVRR